MALLQFCSVEASAQGGDGRSSTLASRSPVVQRQVRRASRPGSRTVSAKVDPPLFGRLSIVIADTGSRIFVSPFGSEQATELSAVVERVPFIFVSTLPAGLYKVVAKKPGYYDEIRIVDVHANKRRKVVMNLRPEMALLTVNTNLADAEIDIAEVGRFKGSLNRHFVKPGAYNVTVQRRGYVAQSAAVNLRMPGREQILNFVLQPMRVDAILAQADEKISSHDLDSAAIMMKDILLRNPSHAKANLLYGQILFERGDVSATVFLQRAISGGETLSLPVKYNENDKLVEIEMQISRSGFGVKSVARADLNFIIARADVVEIRRLSSSERLSYIVLKGKSDFHGRPIEPLLKIHSHFVSRSGESHVAACDAPPGVSGTGRTCETDIAILSELLTGWLEKSP